MSSEYAPCAFCQKVRHIESLDDAMICLDTDDCLPVRDVTPAEFRVVVTPQQ